MNLCLCDVCNLVIKDAPNSPLNKLSELVTIINLNSNPEYDFSSYFILTKDMCKTCKDKFEIAFKQFIEDRRNETPQIVIRK